jgi:DNA-directed RNA polymerase beta subunit
MSTPDGENCGLVKNLAVTAIVSSRVGQPLIESFISCGMSKLDELPTKNIQRMDKIFLNGNWVGCCTDSASFVLRLRCMRRSSLIDPQVSPLPMARLSFTEVLGLQVPYSYNVLFCKRFYHSFFQRPIVADPYNLTTCLFDNGLP